VFLAEMYQSTGRPAYWTALHDALDSAAEFAALAQHSGMYRRMNGFFSPVGAFVGVGAAIYALSRCGHVIGEPPLVRRAAALLPLATEIVTDRTTPADVVLGRAGLLLAIHRLREAAAEPVAVADDLAGRLHEGLLADLTTLAAEAEAADAHARAAGPLVAPYPSGQVTLDGLPHGVDGIVYALARSAAARGRLDADGASLAQHQFALDGAGSVVAALAATHYLSEPSPEPVIQRVLARCEHTWEHSCEQLLIDADVALWADTFAASARPDGPRDDRYRTQAMRLIRSLLSRRERTGKWFGDRRAADQHNLSALGGLAAVGLLCLRLADSEATSPRLVL
jgi:hypothetical protein